MVFFALAVSEWLARFGAWLHSTAVSLGAPGMFLVAIADSSFLSIPEGNDILIVLMSTGERWQQMAVYVMATTLGSILGCILLYTVGRKGGSPMLHKRFSERNVARAEELFRRYGLLAIVIPSILPPPLPFKIFVLSAGVFRVTLPRFITAVAIGRTIRYSMWGILAVLYGTSVKVFMQQNLPKIGIWIFIAFVLGVTLLVASHFHRRRTQRPEVS